LPLQEVVGLMQGRDMGTWCIKSDLKVVAHTF
jgi:hypothetical protein